MASPAARFEGFLEKKGLRLTSQRQEILRDALAMTGHFEAEDLHDRLRKRKSGVSKASVYRTLPLLVEAGLLREVEFVDRHTHYEVAADREYHAHLICVCCREVVEFKQPAVEKALHGIAREHDFEELSQKVEITGLCKRCRRRLR